jgi:hypothetical protein
VLVSLATDSARPDRDNEDFAAASVNVAVLLDGAGTPGGAESGCVHGVAWFTRQLGAQLLAEAAEDDERPLPECLRHAICHTRNLHTETCDLDHPGTPSATVIAIRLGPDNVEYLVLADSVLLFDVIGGDPIALTDDREAQVGRAHRTAMDALPSGSPEHDLALKEYVETLRKYRNAADGFWVAASDASAADNALTGSESLDTLRAVALLSDGASRLADRFHLTDWAGVLQLLGKESPQQLIDRVRAAERDDPRGERWPRGKVHDDATAVYVPLTVA